MKVFISYAHEDYRYAIDLRNALEKPGIEPWLDKRKLEAGDLFDKVITSEIVESKCVIALVSGNSSKPGRYVQQEWWLARKRRKTHFIPIRIEECTPPRELQDLHWDDVFNASIGADNANLQKLIRHLYRLKRLAEFEETFSSFGPDNDRWDLKGWKLEQSDHTGVGSESLYTKAVLNPTKLLPQKVTNVASIPLTIDSPTTLQYSRKLGFSVFLGTASFKVIINDGNDNTIDEEVRTGNYAEDDWVDKSITLTRYKKEDVMLKFVVTSTSSMNYMTSAIVWIDDIKVS